MKQFESTSLRNLPVHGLEIKNSPVVRYELVSFIVGSLLYSDIALFNDHKDFISKRDSNRFKSGILFFSDLHNTAIILIFYL